MNEALRLSALPTLRLLTCGSVDDGKSTLIGRLLYEKKLIFDDQLSALERDSKKFGTTEDDIDFALLVDGLEAEREQGITIDVAYRYFATEKRSFIVADTPGHEQYTRNMATGASNADLAIVLVDARKGLLTQTYRHSIIASLLGIRHIVLAVNKIDLVGYDEKTFRDIVIAYRQFAEPLGFHSLYAIPLSARYGDNVSATSERTPWFEGVHLMDYLERIEVEEDRRTAPFRLPVQWINRPHLDFRGVAGTIASGRVARGDPIVVAGSGRQTTVAGILVADAEAESAEAGDAVTLTLADELDIARGDVLSHPDHRPEVADQFTANVIWMSADAMLPGRSYLMKIGTRTVPASVTELKHRLDVNTYDKLAAKRLDLNEVGLCNLAVTMPVAYDAYVDNRDTGSFILIDRLTNGTAGAGMIAHGLRRATNVHWQGLTVGREAHARLKHQKPAVLWFTGLSGAGKSTIANVVEAKLHARGVHTALLDGDNVRHGLNKDLGFTAADRVENIRRVGEVARLMTDAGLIVLCSFISPFRAERKLVRDTAAAGEFIEIFVDTPLATAIARDPKGLYKKALAGQIKNFTGVDQPYERPESPDLTLLSGEEGVEALADRVVAELERRGNVARF
ncbi:adenylylsulfate kinase /sulfate adenylyltransferase subunit 1 [Roseiarcus fermentans]|uniref:Multifunctional fusion protein n=1 Tax=Roseiarcus fermentans TaxID=1473586 RepID=A0A366ERJ7_9HYPH|nr:sulfate adenylyltransferase subunit CysN [Roseiarcus fermentans]RBP05052.1 adenylylsulfate kinase /sulfate adenylyltransferase subunit 1 [Roseiarcus fermentans]